MKYVVVLFFIFIGFFANAQNIQVDSQTYSAQQLIENILIDSDCITNVVVTNFIGGNFNNSDKSYGYFDATGTTFPFQKGLVLSTGKLSNVDGPNTTLSDDNALNWLGDTDLELALNENNTTNATIIEFEFVAVASQISFNYIFASEEYQQNNANTCRYSDLFGFLIRKKSSNQYTNIALVPNTQTPVKVTTVHPAISGGCTAQNEMYFGSWNGPTAPINFNGQTKVLKANANVIPNETYQVKLVIADEQNYRYDSAVFLEAGSFKMKTDLGVNRLFSSNNPVCFGETIALNAYTSGTNVSYKWFKNGSEIIGETDSLYTVENAGIYKVEVTLNGTCISYGEIIVEYAKDLDTNQNYLRLCDNDTDGLTFFNLHLADPFFKVDMNGFNVVDYFLNPDDAADNINAIANQSVFFNTQPNQIVYARIENEYGCYAVETLTLDTGNTILSFKEFNACDDGIDGLVIFHLNELRNLIKPEVSSSANITFFSSYNDAAYHQNQLPDNFENTTLNSQEIWVKAQDIFCELVTKITLNVIDKPKLLEGEDILYCLNKYPESITLTAGLTNPIIGEVLVYEWRKNGVDLGLNQEEIEVNEGGIYTVKVSNINNCFSERIINVNTSQQAIIDAIKIEDFGVEFNIIVNVHGVGNYEYSLDNGIFQSDNIFKNISQGTHIITVSDLNGCEAIKESISIFGLPNFFTPNNDGKNDTWNPMRLNSKENPITDIFIFNRFGKLLVNLNPNGNGWDGFVNGKSMPSTDYWCKIILKDNQVFQGHFTLIR
jgi:gliding motility-associated-like protein